MRLAFQQNTFEIIAMIEGISILQCLRVIIVCNNVGNEQTFLVNLHLKEIASVSLLCTEMRAYRHILTM